MEQGHRQEVSLAQLFSIVLTRIRNESLWLLNTKLKEPLNNEISFLFAMEKGLFPYQSEHTETDLFVHNLSIKSK